MPSHTSCSEHDITTQFSAVRHWRHGHRPALAYRQRVPKESFRQNRVLVLLLHGLGDSGLCFAKLLQHLPSHWAYVALDFRGHGFSDWLPEGVSGYSQADHVVDLVLFSRHLLAMFAPGHFVVVGHSLGALVATVATAMGGLRVDALVQLEQNGAGGMHPEFFADSQGLRMCHAISMGLNSPKRRQFSSWREALVWAAERHLGAVTPSGMASDYVSGAVLEAIAEVKADGSVVILSDPRIHAIKDGFHLLPREFERTQILPKVLCPVLFLHAEDGPCTKQVCHKKGMPALEDRLADFTIPVQWHTVAAGGHYPHIHAETVMEVATHIETFIKQCIASSTAAASKL